MADKPFLQSLFQTPDTEIGNELFKLPPIQQDSPEPAPQAAAPAKMPQPDTRRPTKTENWLPPADLRPVFDAAAREFDVPVNVLMALGHQESRYNPAAIGTPTKWGRAKGLMQYLDSTAKNLGINPFDPAEAIPAAARQIRERLDKGYSLEDAVKEHFAGPDRKLWGKKTEAYGREVMEKVGKIAEFAGGPSPAAESKPAGGTDGLIKLTPDQAARIEAGEDADTVLGLSTKAAATPGAATPTDPNEQGFFDRAGDALSRGYDNMEQSLATARFALSGGDSASLAQALEQKFAAEQARKKTAGEQDIDEAFQRVTDAKGAWDTTKEGVKAIGTAITNPKDLAVGIVEQLPNMLPTLGAGAAGAGTGAAVGGGVGAAVGGVGAVPGAVGGAIWGGRAGMVAGTAATELGAEVEYMILQKLQEQKAPPTAANIKALLDNEEFKTAARNQGLAKGLTVGLVDQLFMGLAGKVAGRAGAAPTVARKVGTGAAAVGIDATGEVVGEAASQQVARGEVDAGDALREGVYGLGQSVVEPAIGAGMRGARAAVNAARGNQPAATPEAAPPAQPEAAAPAQPAPVQAAPQAAPSGPLTGALEKAAGVTDEPPRATVTAPEGQITGFVQEYREDGQGGFVARVLGDDGQVYQFTHEDGVQITIEQPQAGPLTQSIEQAAEEIAPDVAPAAEQAAPQGGDQTAQNPEMGIPISEQNQGVTEQAAPAQGGDRRPAKVEPPALDALTDEQLRDRLKYVAGQAKNSGGWNKMLITERKRIEKEINARKAAKPAEAPAEAPAQSEFTDRADANAAMLAAAERTGQVHEVVERDGKFAIQPVKEQGNEGDDTAGDGAGNGRSGSAGIVDGNAATQPSPGGLPGNSAVHAGSGAGHPVSGDRADVPADGGAGDAKPALDPKRTKALKRIEKGTAFFGTPEKTQAFIDEHGLADTHEVKQAGAKKFEIVAKEAAPAAEQVAAAPAPTQEAAAAPAVSDEVALKKATQVRELQERIQGLKVWPLEKLVALVSERGVGAANKTIISLENMLRLQQAGGAAAKMADALLPKVSPDPGISELTQPAAAEQAQPAAKPKKLTGKAKAAERERQLADYFTPGNVVKSYSGFDRILDYTPDGNGNFRVKVQQVARVNGEWVPVQGVDGRVRTHSTLPSDRELQVGPVERAPQKSPEQTADTAPSEPKAAAAPNALFAGNKLFTADKVEAARARMRSKLTQLNSGIDPELMIDGMTIAGAYIEAGVRKFSDYAKAMTDDFGDAIKPYLLSFYEGARNYPGLDTAGMSSVDQAKKEHAALMKGADTSNETASPKASDDIDTGDDIPRAFFKKVKVDHDVWIQDEGTYETVQITADKALASVREDIANLKALLNCMKG